MELTLHLNVFFINPGVKCFNTFQTDNQSEEYQAHDFLLEDDREKQCTVRQREKASRECRSDGPTYQSHPKEDVSEILHPHAGQVVIEMSGNCVNFVIWQHIPSVDLPPWESITFPASGEMCKTVLRTLQTHSPSTRTGKKSRCLTPASLRP